MVNLSKESVYKPIREYTPKHLCEEYIPNQALPVVEVVPQKQELAALAENSSSYSQATVDCRKQFLASELNPLFSLSASLKKALRQHTLDVVGAATFAFLSLFCIMGVMACHLFGFADIARFLIGGVFASLSSMLVFLLDLKDDENSVRVYTTIKTASEVYISHEGANYDTIRRITRCRHRINCDVFRPYFCKDNSAFDAVLKDKHDVYVVYSDKTKAAVIIDPKLFE